MLLKFATAGSVDDGKSTLIGRLLYEAKGIYEDQLSTLEKHSDGEEIDLSRVLDGLESEREQGITIDVAHRYFSTPKRQFIIADSPGHVQYTRNFITAASVSNLVVILADVTKDISTQTKRHLFLSSLLNVPHILIVINKMDLVDYSEEAFEILKSAISQYSAKLNIHDLQFIPTSALKGDMVTKRSKKMPWYNGHTLLSFLETVHVASDRNLIDFRFPVQLTLRPDSDFRGYAGLVEGGLIRKGEEVIILPSGKKNHIKSIHNFEGEMEEAFNGQSVVLTLEDEIDLSRGDMLVRPKNLPEVSNEFDALLWWMVDEPMEISKTYKLKHTTNKVKAFVEGITYRFDVETLHREESEELGINDIGRVQIKTHSPLMFDPYSQNMNTGSFILIDEFTNETVAGGIIIPRSSQINIEELNLENAE